jgi:hypothetical protein
MSQRQDEQKANQDSEESEQPTEKQKAFLFTAGVTFSQRRPSGPPGGESLQVWDTCITAIVYGGDAERPQQTFENWCQVCQAPQEDEEPAQAEIKKIIGAELIAQLLTESGGKQPDWPELAQRVLDSIPTTEVEVGTAEDPGYWVDVNQSVPPESAGLNMESLQRGLPEDIGLALNWSPDKKFLFLLSSLSAPAVITDMNEETEETELDESGEQDRGEARQELDESTARLPELREKEAAALIEARNSVVAAWLWRKFAINSRLASNEILVSPGCWIMPAN